MYFVYDLEGSQCEPVCGWCHAVLLLVTTSCCLRRKTTPTLSCQDSLTGIDGVARMEWPARITDTSNPILSRGRLLDESLRPRGRRSVGQPIR